MPLNEKIATELERENKNTRKMLELVPEKDFEWQPHAKSMSLRRLAGHIANLPNWFTVILTRDEYDLTGPSAFSPVNINTSAELLAFFDANIAKANELLLKASDEHLLAYWKLKSGDKVVADMARIVALRSMVLNHQIHHRGQLSVYLRMLDVPLPGIYGPTADELAK